MNLEHRNVANPTLRVRIFVFLCILLSTSNTIGYTTIPFIKTSSRTSSSELAISVSPEESLKRTADHLERLKRAVPRVGDDDNIESNEFESLYGNYCLQPANALKAELRRRNLPHKGRKPDLAKRLAEYDMLGRTGSTKNSDEDFASKSDSIKAWAPDADGVEPQRLVSFAGLKLSAAAAKALGKAGFKSPTSIQQAAIPLLAQGESIILHSETGSGKTLAYLLPITEQLWLEHIEQVEGGYGLILTPTRELAAQVAGVASVLAPPGTVRLVSHATNLMSDGVKDRGEQDNGGRLDMGDGRTLPRLFIGSAKAIMHSLYGDGKMPASPTTKPEALNLLRNVRWVVLDEVDRSLNVRKKHGGSAPRHEKPAAVVASAVARLTLGRAQVVSVSATVGRTLKRELSRVLGLSPKECQRVVRGDSDRIDEDNGNDVTSVEVGGHIGRAVTIPDTVKHYVTPVDTSSVGKLLTNAFFVLKSLNKKKKRRILFVLTRGCNINTQQTIGALKHFGCEPQPESLLDALEASGTDRMIEKHRKVSGATGLGESYFKANDEREEGCLFVTGEDTVRGLHLDCLDVVVVVGRANGPDEYTHIAGRTGRAGREGKVVNVLSPRQIAAVTGWEKMLDVEFVRLEAKDVERLA